MSIVVKYTKSQYMTKINELEGYHAELQTHLTRMEELKEQIAQFWNDENGQAAAKALVHEIRQVKNSMDRTSDLLLFYKNCVDKLDSADIDVKSVIESALSLLQGLGI